MFEHGVDLIGKMALVGFENPVAAAIDDKTWSWLKTLAPANQTDWDSPSAGMPLTAAAAT